MVKVYQMTESVFMTSMIIGVMALSAFFSGLIVTRFIHYFKLKNILVTTSILRIFTVSVLYICINSENLLLIMILLMVQSFFSAWSAPAGQSIIPLLFRREQLREINTFLSTTNEVIQAVGWSLGGILLLYLESDILVIIILCLFALSAVLASLIKLNQRISKKEHKKKRFKILLTQPVVLNITVVDMLESAANTIWTSALLLSFTLYVLNADEMVWGHINALYFAGSIIGRIVLVTLLKNTEFNLFNLIIICGCVMGALTLIMTISGNTWTALAAAFLMGPIYQIRNIYQTTALQMYTDDENRTTVFSARSAILTPWNGVAVMMMGFLAEVTTITTVYILSSVIYILSSVLVYILSRNIMNVPVAENE